MGVLKQIFDPKYISKITLALVTSVPDPDPPDPDVFGPPGTGSFYHKAKK
jgi:hypothetical protein